MTGARLIKSSDMQACPKHSLLAAHYRDDGSCWCADDAAERKAIEAMRHRLKRLTDKANALRDEIRMREERL